ncbi:Polymer-forming cytoskeletal [Delftia tsuruhatensis]|uniref:bactofilin family protein n=1 Tax=Delftia tsuruhatensis TaxID=180282 RepID=UPI001E703DD9|nr:polymer-forming cytoskeletal protein [Delftia tsuruhatensis]CAB5710067.1 Polymer-forming cytoskeletal [Delftia tsuruhatensis]CAC9692044.1 Polymer-forming cytoskeletal [Delftia tsuruhatensis]
MAVQNPFFGKRDNDAFTSRNTLGSGVGSAGSSGTSPSGALNSGSGLGTPVTQRQAAAAPAEEASGGSKLTVGPNIKLKGVEITDCDTLVVEGTVEATMDSRVIQIAEQGAFHGTAEIDIAEIHGVFDGTLTVREKLVIYGTGKVSGKIRYGKVVIEEGGELTGQIEAGSSPRSSSSSSAVASGASSLSSSSAASSDSAASSSAALAAASAAASLQPRVTPSLA